MKKKYLVGYWQTNFGHFKIEAENEKEAREIAEGLDDSSDLFQSTGAEFGIEDIEEEKKELEKSEEEKNVNFQIT